MSRNTTDPLLAERLLTEVVWLRRLACKLVDGHSFEVMVEQHQNLNEVFEQLSAQGLTVTSMRNKANRLEELFVSLVTNGNKAQEVA